MRNRLLLIAFISLITACSDNAQFRTDNATAAIVEYEGLTCRMIQRTYECGKERKSTVILKVEEYKNEKAD